MRLPFTTAALAAIVLAAPMSAPAARAPDASAVADAKASDTRFDALVADAGLPFAGVVVLDAGGPVYERVTPGFTKDRPVPIASASKWVAAALILTAVDRGELALTDTVGKFIPEAPAELRPATLRQLLSHTSGMGGRTLTSMPRVTSLEDSVRKLFEEPMARRPGSAFAYGGTSFQVAGLMLERATKRSYADLFQERLARPLGMSTAKVGSPRSWGTGLVPWVAGGMAMSIDDYSRFLTMMLANGRFEGRQVLSGASVAAIETDAVGDTPMAFKPRAIGDARYGLGVWCEEIDRGGRCGRVSSAGAFGAYPWLDRKAGRAGVFITQSALAKVVPGIYTLRDAVAALPPSKAQRN